MKKDLEALDAREYELETLQRAHEPELPLLIDDGVAVARQRWVARAERNIFDERMSWADPVDDSDYRRWPIDNVAAIVRAKALLDDCQLHVADLDSKGELDWRRVRAARFRRNFPELTGMPYDELVDDAGHDALLFAHYDSETFALILRGKTGRTVMAAIRVRAVPEPFEAIDVPRSTHHGGVN